MKAPLDYPPLAETVFPGDRIALAVGESIPQAAPIVAGALWWLTNRRDIMGEDCNGLLMNVMALIGFLLLLAMAAYTATYKVWPQVALWLGGAD